MKNDILKNWLRRSIDGKVDNYNNFDFIFNMTDIPLCNKILDKLKLRTHNEMGAAYVSFGTKLIPMPIEIYLQRLHKLSKKLGITFTKLFTWVIEEETLHYLIADECDSKLLHNLPEYGTLSIRLEL